MTLLVHFPLASVGGAYLFALNQDLSYTQSNEITYLISGVPTHFGYSITESEGFMMIGGHFQGSYEGWFHVFVLIVDLVGAMVTYNGIVVATLRCWINRPQNASFALSPIAAAIGAPFEKEGNMIPHDCRHSLGRVVIFSLKGILRAFFRVALGTVFGGTDTSLGDKFGAAIAFLRNDTLLVGAPYHQTSGFVVLNTAFTHLGAVYVYRTIPNYDDWEYLTKLRPQSSTILNYGNSLTTYGENQIVVCLSDQENGLIPLIFVFHSTIDQVFSHVIKIREIRVTDDDSQNDDGTESYLRKNNPKNQNFLIRPYGIPTVLGAVLILIFCFIAYVRRFYTPKFTAVKVT
jgi:hypothetical protein